MTSVVLGIRREDKNEWEARVALTPDAVASLVKEGCRVLVQPAPRRVFTDAEYEAVGAEITEDLTPAPIVFAVKEIPIRSFQPGKTYVFFSHTIKGQAYNMSMLRHMMDLGCGLIDYERVVDDQNRRLIFFGWYAGVAGLVDTLWTVNERLRVLGHESPFRGIQPTHAYRDLASVEEAFREVGERIHKKGLPSWLSPFITGFLGYGHVSRGAQHIYDLLPTEEIAPRDLQAFSQRRPVPRDRLFKVIFHESDLVEPKDPSRRFELSEYYQHPERYHSTFERDLPLLRLLINGVYWTPAYPRFVTRSFLRKWYGGRVHPRLIAIGDISCDVEGSVECTVKSTTPGNPVFVYDPTRDSILDGVEGPGVPVMAVDNLPCELPREASRTFSAVLQPFAAAMAKADYTRPYETLELPEPIRRALILRGGELTPPYTYLSRFAS